MNNLRVYLSSGALIASTCVMLGIAKRGGHKPCRSHTKERWKEVESTVRNHKENRNGTKDH
jgi:hypothetical protein